MKKEEKYSLLNSSSSFFQLKEISEDKEVGYEKNIEFEMSEFFEFIRNLTDTDSLQSYKIKHEYMLNRIETWILLKLQDDFLKDPYSLASPETVLFFIPKAIFLKRCKETLGIERDSKDFIHQVSDDLYAKTIEILPEILESKKVDDLKKTAMPRSSSIFRLYEASKDITQDVIRKVEALKPNILLALASGFNLLKIKAISKHIREKYLSKTDRNTNYQKIFNCIKYRLEMDKYLHQELQQLLFSKDAEYNKYCQKSLQELEKDDFMFDKNSESEFKEIKMTPEERRILKNLISEDIAKRSMMKEPDPEKALSLLQEQLALEEDITSTQTFGS